MNTYANPKPIDIKTGDEVAVKMEKCYGHIRSTSKASVLINRTEHTFISSDGSYWFEIATGNLAVGELEQTIRHTYMAWYNGAFDDQLFYPSQP